MTVNIDRAIDELRSLKDESSQAVVRSSTPRHTSWKARTDAVLANSLGENSATLAKFRDLRYHVGIYTGGQGEAARDAAYFARRVDDAAALIEAAIYELSLLQGGEAVEGASYDVGLWQHVRHSVEEQRWEQVASQAAIYGEDKVRRWAGYPRGKDGRTLVGQALFAQAFAEDGPLVLGQEANEKTGWKNLALGLVAAISNVDRHHIQERPDARQYALGVLGLVSLILTQLRHEHSAEIAASEVHPGR